MDPLGVGEINKNALVTPAARSASSSATSRNFSPILAPSTSQPSLLECAADGMSNPLALLLYFTPSLFPMCSYTALASRRRPITYFFSLGEFQSA